MWTDINYHSHCSLAFVPIPNYPRKCLPLSPQAPVLTADTSPVDTGNRWHGSFSTAKKLKKLLQKHRHNTVTEIKLGTRAALIND